MGYNFHENVAARAPVYAVANHGQQLIHQSGVCEHTYEVRKHKKFLTASSRLTYQYVAKVFAAILEP